MSPSFRTLALASALAAVSLGCAISQQNRRSDTPVATSSTRPASSSSYVASVTMDGPEISRSVGVEGGVVILWPRIIPASNTRETRDLAAAVQEHLRAIVAANHPGHPIDVRPEPERVCPMSGCKAIAIGALLLHQEEGRAVVALVSGPGDSPATLVPWVGQVKLREGRVAFREPPESSVTVTDFAPRAEVLELLHSRESQIVDEILAAGR